MCGITGIYNFEKENLVQDYQLQLMNSNIKHRGPDADGFYINKNVGLGHRRLSIIDVENGQQPMLSKCENIAIVLNGEIYNYIELKKELIALGYQFNSNSDTEVVIQAYKEWGVDCQQKLNGMWAFAIWDNRLQRLFLSRDRIGEKPLFYYTNAQKIVFASEMKSFFDYGIPKEPRLELIELYLSLTNIPSPNTFYKNIYKLKPGHCILVENKQVKEIKYWDLPEIDEDNLLKNKKYIYETFSHLFEDSVKIRMRADVPFGAFLSGGLDSSSIVAIMSKNTNFPVETFTMGFPQKQFDESHLAQLVADKFQTKHVLSSVNPDSLQKMINVCSYHFDEPFGDSSAIPTYYISREAVKNVKMVLTGDGGDEVLSGYKSYSGLKFSNMYAKLPNSIQKGLPYSTKLASKLFSGGFRYKLNKITDVLETATLSFENRICEKKPYTKLAHIKELTKGITNKISFEDYIMDTVKKIPYKDDFYKMMYLNIKHDLPNDYLVKVDRMSMANSLETRAPFLDYRLIEFMVGIDKNVKMQGWQRKSVLRNTIGEMLPKNLLNASKKGFGVPLREWFKDEKVNEMLYLKETKKILNSKMLNHIVKENKKGNADYGNFIWTLLMLEKNL